MLLALVAPALAADLPPSLATYEQAVARTTGAVRDALPRLAACKGVAADKLLFKVDLTGVPAVKVGATKGAITSTVDASCQQKIVADVFTRSRPSVGHEAVVVLDVTGPAPRLDGDVALFGKLSAPAIESGVLARMDGIAQCYVNALQDTPGISGEVVVVFAVLPNGQVLNAELKRTTLWSPATEACVLAEVSRATFAEPQGGGLAWVTYPFTFKPPADEADAPAPPKATP